MEITQIKGENIGNKITLQDGGNKIEAEKSLMPNSKLGHFAEIEKKAGGVAEISASHEDIHLNVNGEKISTGQSKNIEIGDSVSFGEKKEDIFAVHGKGEKISKTDVKNHIDKSGYQISDEEFSDILQKLELEEKLVRGLFIGILAVSIFFSGTVFVLNSKNNSISKKIYEQLNSKNSQIEELQKLIGENPNDELECDPEVEDICETQGFDLFSQIQKLEEENKKLEDKISNSSDVESQKKIEEKNSELEEKNSKLEEKFSALEEKFLEKSEKGEKINFDEETKLELSKIISGVVEEINSFKEKEEVEIPEFEEFDNSENLEKITGLEKEISELKENISGEELDFGENGEKVGEAVKILLNRILKLQNDVNNLKKK